jgi:Recombination endonuclease VII
MANCSIEGCPNPTGVTGSARGLCRAHYHRWYRYGDAESPMRRVQSWNGEQCAEAGCTEPVHATGLCVNHYAVAKRAKRRKQDPEGAKRRSLEFKARRIASLEKRMGRPRPSVCDVCHETGYGRGNKPEAGICFDHDHATGVPRGWLCDRCNKVLGLVKDDITLLANLIGYLGKQHGEAHEQSA